MASLPATSLSAPEARAALTWLIEAGVDTLVSEKPMNWLAAPPSPPPVVEKAVLVLAEQPLMPMVQAKTLAALDADVAGFAHPLRPAADARPCLFEGPEAASLLLIDDMAGAEGSEVAELVAAMMKAIGFEMTQVARVHALPWPTTGGRAARAEELAAFAPFARAAVGLARPRMALALGAHLGDVLAGAGKAGEWLKLGEVPLLATHSPARLLRAPKLKAEVWGHLQMIMAGLA
jgi:DNA polymerase